MKSKNRTLVVGVDPGVGGGLAALSDGKVLALERFPNDALASIALVERILRAFTSRSGPFLPREGERVVAYMELVSGFVSGSAPNPGARMFQFGHANGMIETALAANGLHPQSKGLIKVTPSVWQKHFGLSKTKGEHYEEYKRRLKREAEKRYVGEKVTLKNCDALLIARYGWDMERGR